MALVPRQQLSPARAPVRRSGAQWGNWWGLAPLSRFLRAGASPSGKLGEVSCTTLRAGSANGGGGWRKGNPAQARHRPPLGPL